MYKLGIMKGDGIGPEVINSAVQVLKQVVDFEPVELEIGFATYQKYGTPLPDETVDGLKKVDSTLFGAVTTPTNIKNYQSPVVRFRKELDLFANLRPVVGNNVDLIIFRENTEGLYSGVEKRENEFHKVFHVYIPDS